VRTTSPLSEELWAYLAEIIKSDGTGSTTDHKITLNRQFYENISKGSIMPEEFVKRSLQFLVNKEGNKLQQEFDLGDLVLSYPDYYSFIFKYMKHQCQTS
jgi:hypothetical protein